MMTEKFLARREYALDFDGESDYVLTDDTNPTLKNFTVAFWFKSSSQEGREIGFGKGNNWGFDDLDYAVNINDDEIV